MKVSLNTIKQFIAFELPPVDELVARINAQLGGVEEVINLGAKYKDAKIVKVVECEKHPNADKLSVCKIDAGTGELVQVVCGAPNVHADMWAVWLPPESTVPSTYDDKEPFVLGARELRGVMSQGMLAAGDELGINSDHDGILEINADEWRPYDTEIAPGASFAEAFGLNDIIIDIENKMFTHRPDLFGQLGVAREIAGILGHTFESPEWYKNMPNFENREGLELEVFNDAGNKVPRLLFVAMKNISVKPSPLWLQCALVAMGSKAINNIVDVTNYVMLLTAQPTHAYDYDKLRGKKIGARMAKSGEKITLLNGKTYELHEDDIVIADGEGAIGLGGIMGGGNSEVSPDTKNIVLEVATFDMYTARKSSMRHGIFTDALTRFNKGQSPLQNDHVLGVFMASIKDVSPAEQASKVYDMADEKLKRFIEAQEGADPQAIHPAFIRERLGLNIKKHEMVQLLGNVEFPLCEDCGWNPDDAEDNNEDLHINVPFWRTDIHDPEDIVEEIGRLYGFDKLPRVLPTRSIQPAPKNTMRELKQRVRESLSRSGANEVLSYSFVHEKTMQRAEQDVSQAFQVGNALSPDLQYYRLSVLPSLLDKVRMNIKAGHDEFCLFEIGKAHNKKYHFDDDNGLPAEMQMIDGVYASKKPRSSAPYYYVRRLVEQLGRDLGFSVAYKPITEKFDYPLTAPFDLHRSALVETTDGIFIGMVGELKQSVIKNFKLPHHVAAFSLDTEGLKKAYEIAGQAYQSLSKYPSITQDISLTVPASETYENVYKKAYEVAASARSELNIRLEPRTIYMPDSAAKEKTITLRATATSHDRTLKDDEVQNILNKIAEQI